MSECTLSVIIPAYNEAERLGPSLDEVKRYLAAQTYASEIIVVDDGSTDGTVDVAKKILAGFEHQIIANPANRGKGAVVRDGMLRARGRYVLFSDADLSTPISEVEKFLVQLESGYDIVIGSRPLRESQIGVRQHPMREGMGRVFNLIARIFAFHGIRDSQCGFKCFRREAAQTIFREQKLDGFSFDAEIIYLAQKRGYKILESPVIWNHSAKSTVKLFSDPARMFLDLLRIRWIHRGA